MSASTALAVIPKRTGSRVGNGTSLFVEADARSAWARRFRDLVQGYSVHIGGAPTLPQQSLIRRIAAMDIEAERAEGCMASGQPVSMSEYAKQAGGQRRLLAQLGFKASKPAITPADSPLAAHFASPLRRTPS